MDNMNYNENAFKKLGNTILRKVKTTGLKSALPVAVILASLTASCGKIDNDFEYDPSRITTYDMDENKAYSELSVQYADYLKSEGVDPLLSHDVCEKLDLLGGYIEAKENYEDLVAYASEDEIAPYRKKLVGNVGILREASLDLLKIKVREALGLTDAASITTECVSNSADGPDYVIHVSIGDEEHKISDLPRDYFNICNLYDRLNYEGDGTNEKAWTKQVMNEYIDLADELFHLDLKISNNYHQFTYDKTPKIY